MTRCDADGWLIEVPLIENPFPDYEHFGAKGSVVLEPHHGVVVADRQISGFIGRSGFEMISDLARPFSVMVIANLLGVPEEDHKEFCENYHSVPAQIGGTRELASSSPV